MAVARTCGMGIGRGKAAMECALRLSFKYRAVWPIRQMRASELGCPAEAESDAVCRRSGRGSGRDGSDTGGRTRRWRLDCRGARSQGREDRFDPAAGGMLSLGCGGFAQVAGLRRQDVPGDLSQLGRDLDLRSASRRGKSALAESPCARLNQDAESALWPGDRAREPYGTNNPWPGTFAGFSGAHRIG